jgi:hypothetical protein
MKEKLIIINRRTCDTNPKAITFKVTVIEKFWSYFNLWISNIMTVRM